LYINGSAFSENTRVTVGGLDCKVIFRVYDVLTCLVPANVNQNFVNKTIFIC